MGIAPSFLIIPILGQYLNFGGTYSEKLGQKMARKLVRLSLAKLFGPLRPLGRMKPTRFRKNKISEFQKAQYCQDMMIREFFTNFLCMTILGQIHFILMDFGIPKSTIIFISIFLGMKESFYQKIVRNKSCSKFKKL